MRRAMLAFEVLTTLALLAIAAAQHWAATGIEVGLLALVVLVSPAHLRRLTALLGDARPPSPVLLLIEAGALGGALIHYREIPSWCVDLVLAVTLAQSWSTG